MSTSDFFQVELKWNREFEYRPHGQPLPDLQSAIDYADRMLDSGDGERVKSAIIRDSNYNIVWPDHKREKAMSKSIPIDPQHGLNPSLLTCPICLQDSGIAILGRLSADMREQNRAAGARDDTKAPRHIIDASPCSACEEKMKTMICLIESTDNKIQNRTGPLWWVKRTAVGFIQPQEVLDHVLYTGYCLIEPAAAKMIGLKEDPLDTDEEVQA